MPLVFNEINLILPENGVPLNVPKVECGMENDDQSNSDIDIDSGQVDFDDNEKVYNSESEMGSFFTYKY